MNLTQMLMEAKDLNVYKKLLRMLGCYSDKYPATGVDKMFKALVTSGAKALPKDQRALDIIAHLVNADKSVPAIVQEFLNVRFSDLPLCVRPIYKNGRGKEVAFWEKDGKLYDQVKMLVDFEGKSSSGSWADAQTQKVELVDMTVSEGVELLSDLKKSVWTKMPADFKAEKDGVRFVKILQDEQTVFAPLDKLSEAKLNLLLGKSTSK